jgi:hypothetical protein
MIEVRSGGGAGGLERRGGSIRVHGKGPDMGEVSSLSKLFAENDISVNCDTVFSRKAGAE